MRRVTHLAWLPCDAKQMYGLYDGCIEPQAEAQKVPPYLKNLLAKAEAQSESETWSIDAGVWYFGAAAVMKIKAEIEQK